MVCRSCGAEIADKAIVCFRCGAPTAEPVVPPRPAPRRRWDVVAIMLVIVAVSARLISRTTPGSPARVLAFAAGIIVLFAAMAWLTPRRRGR